MGIDPAILGIIAVIGGVPFGDIPLKRRITVAKDKHTAKRNT
jgi:hypothetical protein